MIQILQIITFILHALLVLFTSLSAVRTLILPRATLDAIIGTVFHIVRWFFNIFLTRARVYATRDRIMLSTHPSG